VSQRETLNKKFHCWRGNERTRGLRRKDQEGKRDLSKEKGGAGHEGAVCRPYARKSLSE